ncbi:MAG: hypothetical protein R6X34_05805 [Chloroflexota bacterium]
MLVVFNETAKSERNDANGVRNMPVIGEDVTVTERDVAETTNAARRRDNLKRIDSFINTASAEEVNHIKKSLAYRSMALGISITPPTLRKRDRVLARIAAELVPIILTLFLVIPLVIWGVFGVMGHPYFQGVTAGCPETCSGSALLLWSVVSGVGFLLIILAYFTLRKLMIRARK